MEGLRAPHARVEKVQASTPKREMKPAVLWLDFLCWKRWVVENVSERI